eukprot:13783573-Heterocapsa_arctica.AAC.1
MARRLVVLMAHITCTGETRKRRDLKLTCAVRFRMAAWANRSGIEVSLILECSATPSAVKTTEVGSARRICDPVSAEATRRHRDKA